MYLHVMTDRPSTVSGPGPRLDFVKAVKKQVYSAAAINPPTTPLSLLILPVTVVRTRKTSVGMQRME